MVWMNPDLARDFNTPTPTSEQVDGDCVRIQLPTVRVLQFDVDAGIE